MSLRDIEKQVKEMYDVEMSDTLSSRIIGRITPEINEWQNRTLEPIYPIAYMDTMAFKVKNDNGFLGYADNKEGSKLRLNNKRCRRYFNSLYRWAKGGLGYLFFLRLFVQRCIIGYSMKYAGGKYQKEFMANFKKAYKAPAKNATEKALNELESGWGEKYPMVINSRKNNRAEIISQFSILYWKQS